MGPVSEPSSGPDTGGDNTGDNGGDAARDRVVAGRYRLRRRLGQGAMGTVWEAYDEFLRRTVAVKEVLFPPGLDDSRLEEARRRTMREGRIAAKLHHPQLIAVYDVIEDEGRPYLVMEYMPSTSLSQVLAERGPLPPLEVARLGAQAAAALASAHAAGVVHRDVKPSNILVGADQTVKITDFGVSRVVEDASLTATGTFVGTPGYLAPEVARGKQVTFASDVYSLGATLYTSVEGVSPAGTSDNPMALLHRIASGEITPPKQAGPLTDLLNRLLDPDPDRRPTMEQAREALEEIAEGRSPVAAPPPPVAPAADPEPVTERVPGPAAERAPGPAAGRTTGARNRRGVLVALAALLVLVAVTTTLLLIDNNDDDRTADSGGGDPAAADSSRSSQTSSADEPTSAAPGTSSRTEQPADPDTGPPGTSQQAPDDRRQSNPPRKNRPAADPANAVLEYYALMPGGTDEGWTRMTPRFQAFPARNRQNYQLYWNGVRDVRAYGVNAKGNTVNVTLDLFFKDGRSFREQHRYTLVNQNGRWLLDTVDVVSSVST
jgi:eukaryotic-like serine/threonine-protein kinase